MDDYVAMDKVVALTVGNLMEYGMKNGGIYLEKPHLKNEKELCIVYIAAMAAALGNFPFGIKLSFFEWLVFKLFFKKRVRFQRKLNIPTTSCQKIINDVLKETDETSAIFEVIYEDYYAPRR